MTSRHLARHATSLAVFLLLALQTLDIYASSAVSEVPADAGVLRGSDVNRTVLFVPLSRLVDASGRVEQRFFRNGGYERFQAFLDKAGPCRPLPPSCQLGSGAVTTVARGPAWLSRIESTSVTTRVRVISRAPGVVLQSFSPAFLVTVRVEEVLRARESPVAVGDLLTYLTSSADIEVSGRRLCISAPDEVLPQPGDELLLTGFTAPDLPSHLVNQPLTDVFAIRGSTVIIPTEHQAQPLSSVLRSIRDLGQSIPTVR